jgi:threonine dehydratase
MIDRASIESAAARIAGKVRVTPVMRLFAGDLGLPGAVTLKLESLQRSGSFKARGAFNRILSCETPSSGVITASGGNHGAAVACAAADLGVRAEVFVPSVASPAKIRRLQAYGAHVNVVGDRFAIAYEAMQIRAAETGALIVHPYNQTEVLEGQATLAREFEAQVDGLDTVLVAVGGGGLIGGVAAWFGAANGRAVRVVGVEPEACPSLHRALAAGHPVNVNVGGIAVDSLGATQVGSLMFPIAQAHVERVVLVSDDAIRAAQRLAWDGARLALEPGGATTLAALAAGAYVPASGERVGVVLCGGNVDPSTLEETK